MNFSEAITIVKDALASTGTKIDPRQYDGIIVKKLASSNTLDEGRTTKQTHIAITGEQMDIFPYLCADGYFFDNGHMHGVDLKKYFVLRITLTVFETNCNYLGMDKNTIVFNNGRKESSTCVVRSKRDAQSDQLQISMINMDGSDFINFRHLMHDGTYFIMLKCKKRMEYHAFGVNLPDSNLISTCNNKFFRDLTNTVVDTSVFNPLEYTENKSVNQLIVSDDNNKSYTLDELAEKLKEMYDDPESSKTAGVQVFAIKYGDIIAENDYSIKEIINKSGLSESYTTVLSDAFTTYKTIKSNHFGLAFADNECLHEIGDDSEIYDEFDNVSFIRIGTGSNGSEYESFVQNNYAAIGWNGTGDLNSIIGQTNDSKSVLTEILKEKYFKEKPRSLAARKAGEMLTFFSAETEKTYLVAMKGKRILAIGLITGEYFFDENRKFGHCRYVKWLRKFDEVNIKLSEEEGNLTTCYPISKIRNIELLKNLLSGEDYLPDETDDNDTEKEPEYESFEITDKEFTRNLIVHGAPGTGKSYMIDKLRKELLGDDENYTRVTFHPDYTYASFVGTYKPVPDEEYSEEKSEITYEYVPGPFMTTLIDSLNHPDVPFVLIIEEINRANTAAVFGDVFQLLDRDDTGKSQYPINVSKDMKSYLKKETGIEFSEIRIPSNMFIWATMNSADQGVFPMDTAFKRRWSFLYKDLDESESEMQMYDVILGKIKKQPVNWNKLRKALNDRLTELGVNEDKLIGPFFISESDMKNQDTFSEIFKDKVISYLFEDAARGKRQKVFTTTKLRYSEICKDFDVRGIEIFKFEDVSTDFSPVNDNTGNEE